MGRQRQQGFNLFALHHYHTIAVSDDEITRMHSHPTAGNGMSDAPPTCLVGPLGLYPPKIRGNPSRRFPDYRAPHHQSPRRPAPVVCKRHHDGTHERGVLVAFAIDHQHIAGFGQRHGGVDQRLLPGRTSTVKAGPRVSCAREGFDAAMHRASAFGHVGKHSRLVLRRLLHQAALTRGKSLMMSGWFMV